MDLTGRNFGRIFEVVAQGGKTLFILLRIRAPARFFNGGGGHCRECRRHEPCRGVWVSPKKIFKFGGYELLFRLLSWDMYMSLKIDLEYENGKLLQVTIIKITESKENKSIQCVWLNKSREGGGGDSSPLALPLATALKILRGYEAGRPLRPPQKSADAFGRKNSHSTRVARLFDKTTRCVTWWDRWVIAWIYPKQALPDFFLYLFLWNSMFYGLPYNLQIYGSNIQKRAVRGDRV